MSNIERADRTAVGTLTIGAVACAACCAAPVLAVGAAIAAPVAGAAAGTAAVVAAVLRRRARTSGASRRETTGVTPMHTSRDGMHRAIAALLVVSAALLAFGVERERASAHHEAVAVTVAETHADADGGEHGSAGARTEARSTSEEARLFGIDVESWPFVAVATALAGLLAAGVLLRPRRSWLLAAATFGAVATVFDIAEIARQLDESNTELVVVAAVVAALHVAIAVSAALPERDGGPELAVAA